MDYWGIFKRNIIKARSSILVTSSQPAMVGCSIRWTMRAITVFRIAHFVVLSWWCTGSFSIIPVRFIPEVSSCSFRLKSSRSLTINLSPVSYVVDSGKSPPVVTSVPSSDQDGSLAWGQWGLIDWPVLIIINTLDGWSCVCQARRVFVGERGRRVESNAGLRMSSVLSYGLICYATYGTGVANCNQMLAIVDQNSVERSEVTRQSFVADPTCRSLSIDVLNTERSDNAH